MIGVQGLRDLLISASKSETINIPSNEYLSPAYIIGLASFINGGGNVKIKLPDTIKSFLKRCNYDYIVNGGDESKYSGGCETLKEITLIKEDAPNDSEVAKDFINIIVENSNIKNLDKDDVATKVNQTLILAFSEVTYNITVHSHADFSKNACMYMMQYYPTTDIIRVACVDNGIGIVESLKKSKYYNSSLSELDYCQLALSEGITSNPNEGQGNGLFQCSKMLDHIGGTFEILSGNIYYSQDGQKRILDYNKVPFPGTLVNLELSLIDIINNGEDWKGYIGDDRWYDIKDTGMYDDLRS